MKHLLYLTIFATALLTACNKKDHSLDDPQPNNSGPIRFDHPFVGQQSKYLLLTGEDYYQPAAPNDFIYQSDTLQLTIVAQDVNGYIIEEKLLYNGSVTPWLASDKDSIYHYAMKIENDSVKIKKLSGNYFRSRIFGYHPNYYGLPLQSFTNQKTEIIGWKTDFSYCECYRTAYTENYTQFGINYNRLNVLIQNSPMQLDGPGETFVYEKQYGIVRASTYSWWTQSGIGWDLLP
ncbi:MAG: hypothetical protein IT269_12240 [Saprospiraceae bacterium]|nr:hypothetical protein [Saprospiraceae bacterium]